MNVVCLKNGFIPNVLFLVFGMIYRFYHSSFPLFNPKFGSPGLIILLLVFPLFLVFLPLLPFLIPLPIRPPLQPFPYHLLQPFIILIQSPICEDFETVDNLEDTEVGSCAADVHGAGEDLKGDGLVGFWGWTSDNEGNGNRVQRIKTEIKKRMNKGVLQRRVLPHGHLHADMQHKAPTDLPR